MKVKFRTNLGSRDGKALGLDYEKCLDGKTVDVTEEQAMELGARGWALPVSVKAEGKKTEVNKQENK